MPAMLVTEYVDGERGDVLLAPLDPERRHQAGHGLGRVAASFAGMPMREQGRFVDADLRLEPWPHTDLAAWVQAHPCPGIDGRALRALAEETQDLLDTVDRGWTQVRGGSADGTLAMARAADLPALVELASRRGENPVADAAYDLLRETVASRLAP